MSLKVRPPLPPSPAAECGFRNLGLSGFIRVKTARLSNGLTSFATRFTVCVTSMPFNLSGAIAMEDSDSALKASNRRILLHFFSYRAAETPYS